MKLKEEETTTEKSSEKTNKKNKKTGKKSEKKILLDLVNASKIPLNSIIMDLSMNNLLEQYYTEKENRLNGIPIEPSITEADFRKIIGEKK